MLAGFRMVRVTEMVASGELSTAVDGRGKRSQRMSYELRVHTACLVKSGLEREDDQHPRDALLHPAQPLPLPRPELRADEPDHRNPEALAVLRQTEVDVGKVDQDCDVRAFFFD